MALDENKIYAELGKSVVLFQYLESLVYEITHFALDSDRKESSRIALEGHSFAKLRDISEVVLAEVLREQKLEDAEALIKSYHKLLGEIRRIASTRNKLVHSVYLHLEAGGELMKIVRSFASIKTSGDKGPHRRLEHDDLNSLSFENFQQGCAKVYWELSQFKLHLIHNLHRRDFQS